MSRLPKPLGELLRTPAVFAFTRPSTRRIYGVYHSIARDAAGTGVLDKQSWVVIAAAVTVSLNVQYALPILHEVAAEGPHSQVPTAELIREVGLKCITFAGIPRTINCLQAFREALPNDVTRELYSKPSRRLTQDTMVANKDRGHKLWSSIYAPMDREYYDALAEAHPDLPEHLLDSHYGPLLADAPVAKRGSLATTGRVLTSLIAIACLRTQLSVGPQLLSHIRGLVQTLEDGSFEDGNGPDELAVKWLASTDGIAWILQTVDDIVVGFGAGSVEMLSPYWSPPSAQTPKPTNPPVLTEDSLDW